MSTLLPLFDVLEFPELSPPDADEIAVLEVARYDLASEAGSPGSFNPFTGAGEPPWGPVGELTAVMDRYGHDWLPWLTAYCPATIERIVDTMLEERYA